MPNSPPKPQAPLGAADSYNARLGLRMFLLYLAVYAGFVGMCGFARETMADAPLGVNWAVIYGLGLILGAFVFAVIYMFLCRGDDAKESS